MPGARLFVIALAVLLGGNRARIYLLLGQSELATKTENQPFPWQPEWRQKGDEMKFNHAFSCAAQWASHQSGRGSTFVAAFGIIILWAITGPIFRWSDTWQLIINTGTTIITFLMVFLIQNTQNRDTQAIQLKLDELIRVNEHARNRLLTLEDLTEEQLQEVKGKFTELAESVPQPEQGAPLPRSPRRSARR